MVSHANRPRIGSTAQHVHFIGCCRTPATIALLQTRSNNRFSVSSLAVELLKTHPGIISNPPIPLPRLLNLCIFIPISTIHINTTLQRASPLCGTRSETTPSTRAAIGRQYRCCLSARRGLNRIRSRAGFRAAGAGFTYFWLVGWSGWRSDFCARCDFDQFSVTVPLAAACVFAPAISSADTILPLFLSVLLITRAEGWLYTLLS